MALTEIVPVTEQAASTSWFGALDHDRLSELVATSQNEAVPFEEQQAAFNTVTQLTYGAVLKVASKMTHSADEAQEVAQEAFRSAWEHRASFEGRSRFATWLDRITVNMSLRQIELRNRRLGREALTIFDLHNEEEVDEAALQVVLANVDVEQEVLDSLENERLIEAIEQLPTKMRIAVLLRDVHDLQHDAIAKYMGVSVSAAKVSVHRGRQKLKELMFHDKLEK